MKRLFFVSVVLSIGFSVFISGCVSTGLGVTFDPNSGVNIMFGTCINTDSSSYKKTVNMFEETGSILDGLTSLFHCSGSNYVKKSTAEPR